MKIENNLMLAYLSMLAFTKFTAVPRRYGLVMSVSLTTDLALSTFNSGGQCTNPVTQDLNIVCCVYIETKFKKIRFKIYRGR